ncbi:hypothetical protein J4219_03295 [Candidatus Woesearchaeota archaeon]|nr:hypothetical protein [Candidatus Woesearchaeota archaeon]
MNRIQTYNTGCVPADMDERIDSFFDNIVEKIDDANEKMLAQKPQPRLHPHFEREKRKMTPWNYNDPCTDDFVYLLRYKGGKIAASVIKARDDFNYVTYSFFDNLETILADIATDSKTP